MSGMNKEAWKDIVGFEGLYQVSSLGRVKSLGREHWNGKGHWWSADRIKEQRNDVKGYKVVTLCKECNTTVAKVHRLVALAFIPNPDNLPVVNHKDENKQNPKLDNLEWCTNDYNINYGTAIARASESKKKPIIQLDLNGNIIKYWDSAKVAANSLNITACHITRAIKGKRKSHGGYCWVYGRMPKDWEGDDE